MGNPRFKLSDMMPNAWFHKLKVMSRRASRNPSLQHHTKHAHPTRTGGPSSTPKVLPPPHPQTEESYLQPRRASYYIPSRQEKSPGSPAHPRASDTHFPVEPPRKSKKKTGRKQARPSHRLVSSVSAGSWTCRAARASVWEGDATPDLPTAPLSPASQKEEDPVDDDGDRVPCFDKLIIAEHYDNCDSVAEWSRSCSCKVAASSAKNVVMDMGSNSFSSTVKFEELDLPPILTKPAKKGAKPTKLAGDRNTSTEKNNCHKLASFPPPKDTQKSSHRRSSPPGAHGLRMRATSPRLAGKKIRSFRSRKTAATTPRKCLSESFAVVKSSSDPQRDFRDSMMEMILENNIRASTDLEDLLACYLSLNSNEYHDVIVKVFEQIWFDLTDARCREDRRLCRSK